VPQIIARREPLAARPLPLAAKHRRAGLEPGAAQAEGCTGGLHWIGELEYGGAVMRSDPAVAPVLVVDDNGVEDTARGAVFCGRLADAA
jgi:hypothetical protein